MSVNMVTTNRKLIQNAAYIEKSDRYLYSGYTHDFCQCRVTGCFVDGGRDYLHWGGDLQIMKSWVLYDDSPHLEIYHKLLWGTRGKDGKDPIQFRPISTFSLDHLRNIIKHCSQYASPIVLHVVNYWIKVRERLAAKRAKAASETTYTSS